MGIPKFFRSMSERYPLISQLIEENKIPEFDNLYLDMNGIIHNCSHPNDSDASFRISETQIFLAIFTYIEHLFYKIKPKKLFFLAVDGVAPRAKMNQQRSRRFRTAKEAKELREKAERRGEVLPEEEAFDSNCITPGTPFMARLSLQLQYFIAKKVTEDADWRGVEVVLSGHDVPGEGEHKIMEYIRHAKAQPDYNPNVRHCLYGLDADLIMLGLLSHDPHFCLLREEVSFGPARKKSKGGLESQNFFLLHLSLFREYLDMEFQDLRSSLPFAYNFERIIDDFILLNIFVGNDFLPHLPGLHINEGALDLLFKIYKRILPIAGGYLNESGVLRVDRLQLILAELTKFELEHFEQEYADLNWYKGKQEKHIKAIEQAKARGKLILTKQQRTLFDKIREFVLTLRHDPGGARKETYLPADLPAKDRRFLEDLASSLKLSVSFNQVDPVTSAPAIAVTSNVLEESSSEEDEEDDDDDDDDDEEGEEDEEQEASAGRNGKAGKKTKTGHSNVSEADTAVDRVLNKYLRAKVDDQADDDFDFEEEYNKKVQEKMLQWKKDYYREKLNFDYTDGTSIAKMAYRYVEGLQWVLHYYYDGVASWGWFYDYHYAPKISDLKDVAEMNFDFQLGKPFRPFDQLMGVLPALSNKHIPEAFRDLMTDPNSPIIDFYPSNFETDLNGKKQDWEAVVKIPFIDEKRLLEALDKRQALLSPEEKERNGLGPSHRFTYDEENEHFFPSSLPGTFPDIVHSRAKHEDFHLPTLDGLHLVKGLADGVQLGANALAGFPSVKTLPHYATLGYHGVNVFNSESKNESVIVTVENTFEDNKTEQIAQALVGQRTFISWPYLQEGLVVAVSDHLFKYEMGSVAGVRKVISNPHSPDELSKWRRKAERIEHHYSKRYAVLIGAVEVLLHVRPLKGLKRLEDGAFVKDYQEEATKEVEQALQVSVSSVVVEDARYAERPAMPIKEEYPDKSRVFFLGNHAYGTPAHVVGSTESSLAIEVAFFPNQAKENALLHQVVAQRTKSNYHPSFAIAKRCGLSSLALSKITSSLLVQWGDSKVNVGLNLKFEAKGQKVLGYSRKTASGWEFSDKAVSLIQEYMSAFPEIPSKLTNRSREDLTKAKDFFSPDKVDERMVALKQWIKQKGVRDLEAVPLFAEQLARETVMQIEAFTAKLADAKTALGAAGQVKRVFIKGIPRTALLKPSHAPFRLQAQKFELGDRVIVVQDSGNVPLSARGVVIGINTSNIDVVFDVPFLSGTTLGERCSPYRGGTVNFTSVLNLTKPQFVSDGAGGTNAAPTINMADALERTIGPIDATNGTSNSAARGGKGGAARGVHSQSYRPPNAFTPNPAASQRGRGAGPAHGFHLLQRPPPPALVSQKVAFSGVASGKQKPVSQASSNEDQSKLNPHLAALSLLNGNGAGGATRGARGSAVSRGGIINFAGGRGNARPMRGGSHHQGVAAATATPLEAIPSGPAAVKEVASVSPAVVPPQQQPKIPTGPKAATANAGLNGRGGRGAASARGASGRGRGVGGANGRGGSGGGRGRGVPTSTAKTASSQNSK